MILLYPNIYSRLLNSIHDLLKSIRLTLQVLNIVRFVNRGIKLKLRLRQKTLILSKLDTLRYITFQQNSFFILIFLPIIQTKNYVTID